MLSSLNVLLHDYRLLWQTDHRGSRSIPIFVKTETSSHFIPILPDAKRVERHELLSAGWYHNTWPTLPEAAAFNIVIECRRNTWWFVWFHTRPLFLGCEQKAHATMQLRCLCSAIYSLRNAFVNCVSYLQNVHKRLMVILLYNFFVNTTCGKPCEFKNNSRNTTKIFCVPVATKSCHGYYISLINNSFYQEIFYILIYIYIIVKELQ